MATKKRFSERLKSFEAHVLANLDKIKCPVHLSLGSESLYEDVSLHVRPKDWMFCSHRTHGGYLAKGGNPDKLWDEICGLPTGINQGKAGSQCFSDPGINFHASSIVGGSVGIAVGVAYALRGSGNIVVCCLGDAATEQGVFWESVNFAALKQIPILFICENNGLSINVPINERQTSKENKNSAIWWRVANFGLRVVNDMKLAFEVAREEPVFIEVNVKREGDHCYFTKQSTPL